LAAETAFRFLRKTGYALLLGSAFQPSSFEKPPAATGLGLVDGGNSCLRTRLQPEGAMGAVASCGHAVDAGVSRRQLLVHELRGRELAPGDPCRVVPAETAHGRHSHRFVRSAKRRNRFWFELASPREALASG
jgi:hypothetical protein